MKRVEVIDRTDRTSIALLWMHDHWEWRSWWTNEDVWKQQLQHLKTFLIWNSWTSNLSMKGRLQKVIVYFCQLRTCERSRAFLFSMYFFTKCLCSDRISWVQPKFKFQVWFCTIQFSTLFNLYSQWQEEQHEVNKNKTTVTYPAIILPDIRVLTRTCWKRNVVYFSYKIKETQVYPCVY